MNVIGASGDLGQIRNKPPTYPFCDGNEPWRAPEESPAETPTYETPDNSMSEGEKEYRQWLDCVGRPAPKTREELETRERADSTPGSLCYDPNPPDIELAPDGTRLPDVLWTVPR